MHYNCLNGTSNKRILPGLTATGRARDQSRRPVSALGQRTFSHLRFGMRCRPPTSPEPSRLSPSLPCSPLWIYKDYFCQGFPTCQRIQYTTINRYVSRHKWVWRHKPLESSYTQQPATRFDSKLFAQYEFRFHGAVSMSFNNPLLAFSNLMKCMNNLHTQR